MEAIQKPRSKTTEIVFGGVFVVLMAICSWISVPTAVPFTLQTFAVFIAVETLGGRLGTMSVIVYLILGAIGVPVFAGFSGGLGILLGSTGGYLIGFVFSALVMWVIEGIFGRKPVVSILAMLAGLLVCYLFGTLWFMMVYSRSNGAVSLLTVLGWCVFPFIIPDLAKIGLAYLLSQRIRKLL